MKKNLFLTMILCIISFSGFAMRNEYKIVTIAKVRIGYRAKLKKGILDISNGRNLSNEKLVYLIPRNDSEFVEYYSYYIHKETKRLFEKLDDSIAICATNNYNNAFIYYLKIAMFIYKEPYKHKKYYNDYFTGIDYMISGQKSIFCKAYQNFTPKMKDIMEDYYNNNCK